MARIIIKNALSTDELADKFLAALNALKELGLRPRVGTKLLTRYAVIEVEDERTEDALAKLRAANLVATREAI